MSRNVLELVPHGWLSWGHTILRDGVSVAEVDQSWFRERAEVRIADMPHVFRRESVLAGTFALESAGGVLASAHKTSLFSRRIEIDHAGQRYELVPASLFLREMQLWSGGRIVGGVRPKGPFTRSAWIELPEGLPLPVGVFIGWLALMLWRRRRRD